MWPLWSISTMIFTKKRSWVSLKNLWKVLNEKDVFECVDHFEKLRVTDVITLAQRVSNTFTCMKPWIFLCLHFISRAPSSSKNGLLLRSCHLINSHKNTSIALLEKRVTYLCQVHALWIRYAQSLSQSNPYTLYGLHTSLTHTHIHTYIHTHTHM